MMRAFGIDTNHLTTEELTVCGGVMVIVVSNEIMDHLMQYSVLHHRLRQVDTHIDAQLKIFVFIAAEESLLAARIAHLAQEPFRMTQFDGHRR